MQPADARAELEAGMIAAMVDCAHALGMAAGEIAKACRKDDHKGFFAASAEFRQCFFAVRMGIRLRLNLQAAARSAVERPAAEHEPPEREPVDAPARERSADERDREREGDYEPVSLPQFLKSLRGVARAAERRKAELPLTLANETLPKLHALLAEANASPPAATGTARAATTSSGVALLARPPEAAPSAARSRLLGSAAAPPRGPPRSSG